MKTVLSIPLLRKIKEAQPEWFSRSNKRFFNDKDYKGYYGKVSGNPFLVRSTYAWTDMFGQKPRLHYKINRVNPESYKIESLIDTQFTDIYAVKTWLNEN